MKQQIKNHVFKFVGLDRFYAVIDHELTSVKVVGYVVCPVQGTSEYRVELPNGDVETIMNDCDVSPFFEDQASFERGECVKPIYECFLSDIIVRLNLNCSVEKDENGNALVSPSCWVMECGEPKERDVMLGEIHLEDLYHPTAGTDSDIPTEYWKTREDCVKWNDYVVREADGRVHIEYSRMRALVPTLEQRDAIQGIVDAYKKARELGVKFCWDAEGESLFAINGKNIATAENTDEYSHNRAIEKGKQKPEGEFFLSSDELTDEKFSTGINILDFWMNCDLGIYTTLKKD